MSDVLYHLQATHTRQSPVFVIGYPRSGTSLTCRLLRRYLKVSFGTESQFILRYLRKLGQYGDLRDDDNARRLIDDISTERFFFRTRRNWGFAFDPDEALASLKGRTYADVLHAVFGQLARHNGMVRWGDKTPQYNSDLRSLHRLFPDAQFVHVVRDGRDIALSIAKTGFGPKNACECAEGWSDALNAIRAFGATLPRDQFHEVRYEDLTQAPAPTLASLAAFLGIDDAEGTLSAYIQAHAPAEVRSANSGQWRRALHPREIERFEGVSSNWLKEYRYDLAFQGTARRLGATERLFWRMRGGLDRLTVAGYWADNWYKLRLRTEMAVRHVARPR